MFTLSNGENVSDLGETAEVIICCFTDISAVFLNTDVNNRNHGWILDVDFHLYRVTFPNSLPYLYFLCRKF